MEILFSWYKLISFSSLWIQSGRRHNTVKHPFLVSTQILSQRGFDRCSDDWSKRSFVDPRNLEANISIDGWTSWKCDEWKNWYSSHPTRYIVTFYPRKHIPRDICTMRTATSNRSHRKRKWKKVTWNNMDMSTCYMELSICQHLLTYCLLSFWLISVCSNYTWFFLSIHFSNKSGNSFSQNNRSRRFVHISLHQWMAKSLDGCGAWNFFAERRYTILESGRQFLRIWWSWIHGCVGASGGI